MIGLASSTYHYKPKVEREERELRDAELRERIEQIHVTFPEAGYRTLQTYLRRDFGLRVNAKRVRRVQKKYSLMAEVKRKFVVTTDSDHDFEVHPNLIREMQVTGVNQVWVTDITYIRIRNGFVYLAAVMDVFSRRVIGWEVSRRIDHELTCAALARAIELRRPPKGVIHHSDRGVQYCCHEYRKMLVDAGMFVSCSSPGNPYDNAFMESFIGHLKREQIKLLHLETIFDVVKELPRVIEEVYNRKRAHSRIGYLPPVEFEEIVSGEREGTVAQPSLKL
jgi:putative transposase